MIEVEKAHGNLASWDLLKGFVMHKSTTAQNREAGGPVPMSVNAVVVRMDDDSSPASTVTYTDDEWWNVLDTPEGAQFVMDNPNDAEL